MQTYRPGLMRRAVPGVMPGPMPIGPQSQMTRPILGSFKKGGKVKKTGAYKLHKGERVLPTKLSSLVKG